MKIGNTSISWECGSQRGHFFTEEFKDHLPKLVKRFSKSKWWVASVLGSQKNRMRKYLQGVHFHWVELADVPGEFAYQKNFGIDRALNIYAVRVAKEFPAVIIDCGTAITIEFIDFEGAHQGGWITPGVRLQIEALHKKTDALPAFKFKQPLNRWGRSTKDCMNAGIFSQLTATIESARQIAEEYCGKKVNLILTGGWARTFSTPSTRYRGRLVFEALSHLAKQKVADERSSSTLRRSRHRT